MRSSEARGSSILKSMPPEEVQVKRSRGELSCAECRRCRIRCDRKVPCGSCVRRGCVQLCPNGSLRAGHGSRFVLADTEELHSQIAQMSQRIRQLEDALSVSHDPDVQGDRHPLLSDELLAVKFGSGPRSVCDENEDQFSLSFGTLAVTDTSGSSYFGVSAGVLAKPLAEQASSTSLTARVPPLVYDIWNHNSRGQPELPDDIISDLRRILPSRHQAVHLCEQYTKSYRFQPLQIGDLMDDILRFVYEGDLSRSPHKAAVLYFVFAAATLMDPSLPRRSTQAQAYCELGLKALDLWNVSTSAELDTVIAISLLATYHGNLGTENCLEIAWEEMSLALKIAQKIGLHREPSRWNLEPQQVRKRRRLFWELMFQDGVRSLSLGRPPTMSLKWVDCDLPSPDERAPEQILAVRQYSLTREVIWPLMELMGSTSPSSYGAVLELDKKIRELSAAIIAQDEQFGATMSTLELNCMLGATMRQAILLSIHRPFLALALIQHPENPSNSPYFHSVNAAQSAASFIIRETARCLEKAPELTTRQWDVWVDLPSAAITAASIANHAPNMFPTAMNDLDLAINILGRGADYSWHARVALPFVTQMRQRTNGPVSSGELGDSPMLGVSGRMDSEEPVSGDDDLYLFTSGRTFGRSGRRLSAPTRSFSVPTPRLPPLPSTPYPNYSDPGFDMVGYSNHHDGYSTYSTGGGGHGGSHGGYQSSASTPGMPPTSMPGLELFPLEAGPDGLGIFGGGVGEHHHHGGPWLQAFGPAIGYAR